MRAAPVSLPLIRRALEAHLDTLPTVEATLHDNDAAVPRNRQPHRRLSLIAAETVNPTWSGVGVHVRDAGIFQVLVCVPEGAGVAQAELDAQAIRDHFRAGESYLAEGVRVRVARTPSTGPGLTREGYYCVPVSVRYECNTYQ